MAHLITQTNKKYFNDAVLSFKNNCISLENEMWNL